MLGAAWNSFKFIGVALPASLAFLDHVGSVARVHGSSMAPTLRGDKTSQRDYVWLNSWAVRNFQVQRGDVVIFHSPTDPNRILIKRIVALEGDVVQSTTHKQKSVRVRQGCMWIEGDNKEMSMDSHSFGQVPRGLIIGKASHIIWPPNRWGKITALPEHRSVSKAARSRSIPEVVHALDATEPSTSSGECR